MALLYDFYLDKKIFKRDRVCQVFMDKDSLFIEKDYETKHLFGRITMGIRVVDKIEDGE